MILSAIITLGFAASAAALTLARLELAMVRSQGAVAAPFGDAIGSLMAWIAYAATLTASLIALGVPWTLILAVGSLILGRLVPAHPVLFPLLPYKLPLAVFAILLGIAALIGVLTLIQGVITNV